MKIGICGSHGTGKTTLVNSVNFELTKITNLTRELISKRGNPKNMSLGQKNIFQYTLYCEMFAEHRLTDSFISDRTIFDVLAYTEPFSHHYAAMKKDSIKYKDLYDVVLYIPIEFELEKDGVRYEDLEFQKTIDERLKNIFRQLNISFITITGTFEERVKKLEEIIKAYKQEN